MWNPPVTEGASASTTAPDAPYPEPPRPGNSPASPAGRSTAAGPGSTEPSAAALWSGGAPSSSTTSTNHPATPVQARGVPGGVQLEGITPPFHHPLHPCTQPSSHGGSQLGASQYGASQHGAIQAGRGALSMGGTPGGSMAFVPGCSFRPAPLPERCLVRCFVNSSSDPVRSWRDWDGKPPLNHRRTQIPQRNEARPSDHIRSVMNPPPLPHSGHRSHSGSHRKRPFVRTPSAHDL